MDKVTKDQLIDAIEELLNANATHWNHVPDHLHCPCHDCTVERAQTLIQIYHAEEHDESR